MYVARELKTDAESVRRRETQQRKRTRDRLIAAGLPVPAELEKRPTRRSEFTEGERKKRAAEASARYRSNHSENVSDATLKRRRRNQQSVYYQKANPCSDCGGHFPPVCMDFDHREGEDKKYDIAKLVYSGAALDTLYVEMAKCDLVCANCHRLRSAKRGDWDGIHEPQQETIS